MFSTHTNRRLSKRSILYSAVQNAITGVWTSGTPSVADYDANYDKTVLLLTGDGTNNQNNNSFLDSSASSKILTRTGTGIGQGAFNPYGPAAGNQYLPTVYGGSGYFPNDTAQYLSTPWSTDFDFTTGDFTIEFWFYLPDVTGNKTIFSFTPDFHLGIFAVGNKMGCFASSDGGSWNIMAGDAGGNLGLGNLTFNANTWNHYAWVRSGNTWTQYLNGAVDKTNTSSAAVVTRSDTMRWGIWGSGAFYAMSGYLASFHIIKGTAKYTSTFSPPSTLIPAHANTKLLLNFANGGLVDSTGKHHINVLGDTKISNTQSKFGGTSMYFDGTGDYLTLDGSSDFAFGTGDFTIECWVYRDTTGTNDMIYDARPTSTNGAYIQIMVLSSNVLRLFVSSAAQITGTTPLNATTWYHVAVSRVSGVTRMFLNGTQEGSSWTDSTNYLNPAGRPFIGMDSAAVTDPFQGYIDDLRITKGLGRYAANFTPPSLPLPTTYRYYPADFYNNYWNETKLLLQGDFVNSNTSIIRDNSKNRYSPVNVNMVVSNTQQKFGTHSLYNGGSGYLSYSASADFTLGTGDFTIEAWIYPTSISTNNDAMICGNWNGVTWSANNFSFHVDHSSVGNTDKNSFWVYNYSSSAPLLLSTSSITTNVWRHVAVTRVGSTFRLFVNGVLEATATYAGSIDTGSTNVLFVAGATGGTQPLTGYMDDFRFTKGVGRYTQQFIPPGAAFIPGYVTDSDQYWSSTSLLLHADGTNNQTNAVILDSSGLNKTVTRSGDVAQGSVTPYTPAALVPYNTSTHGGSAYFDGTGDYLSISGGSDFAFGTGDFTIEFWVYAEDVSAATQRGFCQIASTTSGIDTVYTNGLVINIGNVAGKVAATIGATVYGSAGGLLAANTWAHIALTRQGGNVNIWLNGVSVASGTGNTTDITYTYMAVGGYYSTTYLHKGYIANFNVIKGTAKYTTAFTAPSTPVTPHANTKLLLNFTNAAIYDSTVKQNLIVAGDTKTMVSINKFGGSSMYFDGVGDSVTINNYSNFSFGTGDFTIEAFIYVSNFFTSTTNMILCHPFNGVAFALNGSANSSTGSFGTWQDNVGGGCSGGTININTWYHVATTRSSGLIRIFVDGVQVNSVTNTNSFSSTYLPIIGQGYSSQFPFNGYIDDLRVTKGVARYLSNFEPPTKAHPNF